MLLVIGLTLVKATTSMSRHVRTYLPWMLLFASVVGFTTILLKQNGAIAELNSQLQVDRMATEPSRRSATVPSRIVNPPISNRTIISPREDALVFAEADAAQIDAAADRVEAQVEDSLGRVVKTYDPLFRGMGMDSNLRAEFGLKIAKIEEDSAIVTEKMRDLQSRRHRFDNEMRAALSEEQYQNYRNFEETRIPRQIVDDLNAVADRNGLSRLTAEQEGRLIRDMVDFQVFGGIPNSFGPTGRLPKVSVGVENIISDNNEAIGRLEGEGQAMAESNPDLKDLIATTFTEKSQKFQKLTDTAVELDRMLKEGAMDMDTETVMPEPFIQTDPRLNNEFERPNKPAKPLAPRRRDPTKSKK